MEVVLAGWVAGQLHNLLIAINEFAGNGKCKKGKMIFRRKTREERFWQWFKSKKDAFYLIEEHNINSLLQHLTRRLHRIHKELTYELGPASNGKRTLVISSDGNQQLFPLVENLINQAPEFKKWRILAFRQPKDIDSVELKGKRLRYDEVKFSYKPLPGRLALTLFVNRYQKHPQLSRIIVPLLLQNLIGEYETATYLTLHSYKDISEAPGVLNIYPLPELKRILNEKKLKSNHQ